MGLGFSQDDDYDDIDADDDLVVPVIDEIPFLKRDHPALKRGYSAIDIDSTREWECLLVFKKGDEEIVYETEEQCEEIRPNLGYQEIIRERVRHQPGDDSKEPEEDDFGLRVGMTQAEFYEQEKRRVLTVLEKLKLRVEKCHIMEYQGEGDDEEKKELEFFYVGITEERGREWAAETGYELELNPQKAIDYLYMMDEPLALATRSEESIAIRVRESNWKYCYVKFFKNVPPQIYYQYPLRSDADKQKFEKSMFRTRDRLALILDMVQSDIEEGGAGIYVASLKIKEHPIQELFPIHNVTRLDRIMNELLTRETSHFQNYPLEEIRDYFGEYVALYFAFLQFQTHYFAPAAAAGVLFFAYSQAVGGALAPGIGYVALASTMWSMLYPVFWKRREYFWAMHWGQARFDLAERARPEYEGEYQKSAIHGRQEEYFPPNERFSRQMCSYQIFVGFLISLLIAVGGVMFLRVVMVAFGVYGTVVIGVANGLVIVTFNNIYGMVAEELNSWENYRTDTEYENSLIMKVFVFKVINSYAALWYMAFVLRFQPHKQVKGAPPPVGCKPAACMSGLGVQVAIIFIMQLTINNVTELGGIIAGRYFSTEATFSSENEADALWAQWKSEEYLSTFEDFNELLIQFGYASLFFVSFPLAPLLTWLSLALEARVDGYKLCRATRRPFPRGADDIGTWQVAQEFMGWASLFTNLGLIILITQDIIFPFNTIRILFFKEILTGMILFIIMYVVFRLLKDVYAAAPTIIERHIDRQIHIENELETASELIKTYLNRLAANGKDLKRWRTWNVHQVNQFVAETLCINAKVYQEIQQIFANNQVGGQVFETLTPDQLARWGVDNENYATYLVELRNRLIEAEELAEAQAGQIDHLDESVTAHYNSGEVFEVEDLVSMAEYFEESLVGYSKRRLWQKVDENRTNRIEEDELSLFIYYAIAVYMKAKDENARLPKRDDQSIQAVIVPLSDWLTRNKLQNNGLTYEEFDTEFPDWLRQYVRQRESGIAGGSTIRGDPLYDPVAAEWDGRLMDVVDTMSSRTNVLDGLWKKVAGKKSSLNVDRYMPRLIFGLIALYSRMKGADAGITVPDFNETADWTAQLTHLIKSQLPNPENMSEEDFKENFLRYLRHTAQQRNQVHAVVDAAGSGDEGEQKKKRRGFFGFGRRS